jgi:hypothetical protein
VTTADGLKELQTRTGPAVHWRRLDPPNFTRKMTIYPETLTAEQRLRLEDIEQELLAMAYTAEEEVTTVLRGK